MPWHVARSVQCPPGKPYAVIKDSDSSVVACHPTKESAEAQMRALYVNEPKARASMADITGLELARPGTWELSSGTFDCTEDHLRDAVAYAARPQSRPAPARLGHTDPRFDGEPALGWLTNLRIGDASDGDGIALLGDVIGAPDWLSDVAATAYPDRSLEGWADHEEDGRTYKFIIDGLAFLGVTPPGMSTIRSLRDLPQALGVAAGARIVATIHTPTQPLTPETPAGSPPAGAPPPTGEESVVAFSDEQITNLRQLAGVAPDADEATILAALKQAQDEAASIAAAAAPPPPQATTPPEPSPQPQPQPTPQPNPTPPAPPGSVTIDTATLQQLQDSGRRADAMVAKMQSQERDQLIHAAVFDDKKFPPSRIEHWRKAWDTDPDGTKAVIASMPRDMIPTQMLGSAGDPENAADEFDHLFSTPAGGHR